MEGAKIHCESVTSKPKVLQGFLIFIWENMSQMSRKAATACHLVSRLLPNTLSRRPASASRTNHINSTPLTAGDLRFPKWRKPNQQTPRSRKKVPRTNQEKISPSSHRSYIPLNPAPRVPPKPRLPFPLYLTVTGREEPMMINN